ncbi:MAG: dual specificity protein phosphatase family protein [Candidatus Aureabacteria bacterium]|nr:dual specificity protein phosphatase family protein [Candidatus Auribacterota bacterium]
MIRKLLFSFYFSSAIFCFLSGIFADSAEKRPVHWAEPLKEENGLFNFYKVSDSLYRGAQPEDEGFFELKKMGLKTVINLRTFHSDRKNCDKAGLQYVHITVQAWEGEDKEVVQFLRVVTDKEKQPFFVHCQHGADRTGVMCAVYRIAVQGWSKEEAIKEMTDGGYGFHSVWQNLIEYIQNLDIKKIKKEAGLET